MAATDRATELDAMRGIAAFAVVVFHAIENLPDRDLLILRVLRGTPLRPFLDGRQPVVFFFVLSGLVLTRALLSHPPGYLAYALRRVTRLCLPTVAVVLLSAVLYGLCHTDGTWPAPDTWLAVTSWTRPPSAEEILRHISLTGADGDFQLDAVLWTLVHELRLSLLLPLAIAFAVGRDQRSGLLLLMAGSLLLGLSLGDRGLNDDGFGEKLGGGSAALLVSAIFLWIAWCAALPRALVPLARGTASGLLLCGLLAGIALGWQAGDVGHLMLGPSVARSFVATLCFAPGSVRISVCEACSVSPTTG